jgi:hypothetical protein
VTAIATPSTGGCDALDLLAGLVLENGRRWAAAAEAIQWVDARAILEPGDIPYHFLTRARGRSKTTDLAGMTLAVMLTQAGPGDRLYATAADKAQGGLLINSMRGFAERSGLAHLLRFDQFKVTVPGGAVLEVLGDVVAGSYGRGPYFVVVDEIAQWPNTSRAEERFDAIYSSMHKRDDARMVLLTTAGDPAHWSYRIREHAMSSSRWRLHEVQGPPSWSDPLALEDQRELLPAFRYQRLFENQWTAGNESFTTLDDVQACVRHAGPLQPLARTDYVIGVDLGWRHDPSVAVVAHLAPNPERGAGAPDVVWDRHEIWAGSQDHEVQFDQVEAWVLRAARTFNNATVVMDAREGVGMAQRLRDQRLKVEAVPFSARVNTDLARTLLPLLRAHRLDLPDDEHLIDELVNLRITETADGQYRIEHTHDRHNDQAIAFALATHHLLNQPPRGRVEIIV